MSLRERGQVISGCRVTIPDTIKKKLDIRKGDFFEMEVYGNEKILITFFKVGKRSEK